MKILLLSLEPPSLSRGLGGISQQLFYMLKSLSQNHSIDIISYQNGDYIDNCKYVLIHNILHTKNLSYLENIHSEMNILNTYLTLLDKKNHDVVIYADIFTYSTVKFIKHINPSIKTIFLFSLSHGLTNMTSHYYADEPIPSEVEYSYTLEQESCSFADHVVVNSDWIYSYFPPIFKNISIIPNFIHLNRLQNISPRSSKIGTKKYKLGYIQRIASNKGINQLLNAKIPENVDLIIMGSTGDLVSDSIIGKVCSEKGYYYIGKIEGDERFSIFKTFDFTIYPNLHEPFCISILESLACNVIPIYTDIPGMGNLFDEKCGIKISAEKNCIVQNIENGIINAINLTADEINMKKNLFPIALEKYTNIETIYTAYKNIID